jgi:hypothetical protein
LGIVNFPGPLVTFRGFKQYSSRLLRTVSEKEFKDASKRLLPYGQALSLRVARQSKPTSVFLKKSPEEIQWAADAVSIARHSFEEKVLQPLHHSVGPAIQAALVRQHHVREDFFNEHSH